MRAGRLTLVALFAVGCSEVQIQDGSGGGSSVDATTSSGATTTSATTGAAVSTSVTTGAGGSEFRLFPICGGVPDTFDVGIDETRWSLAPAKTATVDQGQVVLTGLPGYLQLEAAAVDCAFTFEVLSLGGGEFLELEVVGPNAVSTGIRAMNDASGMGDVAVLILDGDEPVFDSYPDMPVPIGLGLVFRDTEIGYFARQAAGWTFLAAGPRPQWVDETGPEVRFIGFDEGSAARIDDYGVHPIPIDAWPDLKD